MAISPPTERLWWKTPIHRPELIWIIVAFLWGLVMFFMMIYWHAFGQQNLATETYRTTPNAFYAKTEAMVQQYRVRDVNGLPVVRPPAGGEPPPIEQDLGHLQRVAFAPERIEPAGEGDAGDNLIEVAIEQDKFFGATRALVARAGTGRLAIETASREAVRRVRIPRDAIQFLDGNSKEA